MGKKITILLTVLSIIVLIGLGYIYLKDQNIMLINTKGIIAEKQRNLIFIATGLMLIIVIPVYFMAAWFPYRYRESRKSNDYRPDYDSNNTLETIWWGIPIAIIGVIAVITWISTHELDPYKPLAKKNQQKTIQVISMQWKWLFIYPEEKIVSVNKILIPEDKPISFQITSDAPMNSFWIPQLAGQIYSMNGMSTMLHIEGNELGSYEGMSSNISGEGFSDMRFKVDVVNQKEYDSWVDKIKQSNEVFGMSQYKQLSTPSIRNVQQQFVLTDEDIYQQVMAKYMAKEGMTKDNHQSHAGGGS